MINSKNSWWNFQTGSTIALYSLAALSLVFMLLTPYAATRFGIEDGPAENITALLMLISSVIMLFRGLGFIKKDSSIGVIALLIAASFFVFAGEEISWGQRLLGLESNEFMQEYNWQGEINFHNLHTDLFNLAFHYGAIVFLIAAPLFRSRVVTYAKKTKLTILTHFIAPTWIAFPSFALLGMLDSRFVFSIEKPWAASLYLLALTLGVAILLWQLKQAIRLKKKTEIVLLGGSLALIALGILVSYFYAVDKQAPNIISEYKELFIAAGLFVFALGWKRN